MRKKIYRDITSSTFQIALNQTLGLLIFFITSRYLSKDIYGELNWSLAVLTFSTSILSLRLEQIIVHKVASGEDPSKMLTLFTAHVFGSGLLYYAGLLLGYLLFPSFFTTHHLLALLAISHLLGYFSLPFKQISNGKENFVYLAIISSISNIIRALALSLFVIFAKVTIEILLVIYITSSLLELLASVYFICYKMQIRFDARSKFSDYKLLLRQSLPQIGSVILMATIARIDWILLGIFASPTDIAEYSFAYKVYELSPLPMLILAPILLSRLSKYFSSHPESSLLEKAAEIKILVKVQMLFATLLPLIINILWAPLVDHLTNNKYGQVNSFTFLILSLCIPFQYMINFLWSIHFTQNRLKLIFKVSLCTCLIIVLGDLFVIPEYKAPGAAVVYLVAIATEYILYLKNSILTALKEMWQTLISYVGIALFSGFIANLLIESVPGRLLFALILYAALLIITRQVSKKDILLIKGLYR